MLPTLHRLALAVVFLFLSARLGAGPQPNLIFVLCDDLGYGDLGVFFQNQRKAEGKPGKASFQTPEIDRFAAEGLQLRDHYCPAPVCAPSRASLLLGVHQGHANVRNNQFDKALEDNHTLATVMREAGYATYAVGKWGVQGGKEMPAHPLNRGFDRYFGYISHNAGHAHYPKEDGQALFDGRKEVGADYAKCYTTDLFAARAKEWIIGHHKATPDKPFFLYLAFDTPHAKSQLASTAYPPGKGLAGGLQWKGAPGAMINTATGTPDSYFHPDYANATWNDGGATKPWPDVAKRYASMIRRIDDTMADLVQTLKDLGVDNNTLVVFTSDNGPSQESYLKGKDPNGYGRDLDPGFFAGYGPFDGIKRDCWEGGIRVGAIARWPGTIPAGTISHQPSQFHDWMPTFAELAGIPAPARTDGVSLVPTLRQKGTQAQPVTYVEYEVAGKTPNNADFETSRRGEKRGEMQMMRIGDMVGVRYDLKTGLENFEIYDIAKDPGQRANLASSHAALQRTFQEAVLRLRRPNPSAPRPYDAFPVPAVTPSIPVVSGLTRAFVAGRFPWVPNPAGLSAGVADMASSLACGPGPAGAVVFRGYLKVAAGGPHSFQLSTNTRAFLRLNQAALLDADFGRSGETEVSASITLAPGLHAFTFVALRAEGVTPRLDLQWSGPGFEKQPVPPAAFFQTGN